MIGLYRGYIGAIQGLYRDNGKGNGDPSFTGEIVGVSIIRGSAEACSGCPKWCNIFSRPAPAQTVKAKAPGS